MTLNTIENYILNFLLDLQKENKEKEYFKENDILLFLNPFIFSHEFINIIDNEFIYLI